jgi:hypothetical protein
VYSRSATGAGTPSTTDRAVQGLPVNDDACRIGTHSDLLNHASQHYQQVLGQPASQGRH